MFTTTVTNGLDVLGRILLAAIFLMAGIDKISNYAGTQGYMEAMGVSGSLLPLVIILEIVAPIMLILGFKARYAAIALAGFSVLSAILFHAGEDQMQQIMFMKNFTIAGGLLLVAAHGVRAFSIDKK